LCVVLAYACPAWHSSLTKGQTKALEDVQCCALQIINNNMTVSIQPAEAQDFWPLESCQCHFPNTNPNLQNTLEKNFKNVKK